MFDNSQIRQKKQAYPKFLFYLCGDKNKASSRVRGYWLIEVLTEKGIKCSSAYGKESSLFHYFFNLIYFFIQIPFYDVIFFQKTYSKWHCYLLKWAKIWQKMTILDLDDAPSRTNKTDTLNNVTFMFKQVNAVLVGSQALFEYASQYSSSVYLIPSSIHLKYYTPSDKKNKTKEPICIGWIGNGKHYQEDLICILKQPLTEIAQKHPIKFKIIGACGVVALHQTFNKIPNLEVDLIDEINWSAPTAVQEALKDIDIGVYPLLSNQFNQYKCGFKALEYMAMKIPVISSNVAENRDIIIDNVTGLFANTPQDWTKQIESLLRDEEKRNLLGHQGLQRVESHYNIYHVREKILEAVYCTKKT